MQSVCVVGVPDSFMIDYLPTAVVIKQPNSDHLTDEVITKAVADKFPTQKHLHGGVYFVDSLPMTPTGKFKKKLVTDIATKRCGQRETLS